MGNFNIRKFRSLKDLKQNEFAELIGLTQSNLSRYEKNGIDLTEAMLEKLRSVYGKEDVDAFLTDSAEQISEQELPPSKLDGMALLDMITIIKKQNDTICQQVEAQKQFTQQLTQMNDRLLNLLEKIQFD